MLRSETAGEDNSAQHLQRRCDLPGCSDVILKSSQCVMRKSCSIQLTECFHKLINPPITTHSRFDLNESMSYPAITFCRNPPYKFDVMERYNLSQHPKYANAFNKFDFSQASLDDLFRDATYNESEFFIQYGLDGLTESMI